MYLLLTDETNLQPGGNVEFFSYGGLIVPLEKTASLNSAIENIRTKHGYQPADRLKFDTNARPVNISVDSATAAKKEVIAACIDHECKFLAYVVLHAIAQANPINTIIQWGADHVIGKFNFFLECKEVHGIVAMDRLPDGVEFDYLANKFVNGLALHNEGTVQLDRIVLFSSTCINASHLTSAMDIVLGSWRYCINNPFNEAAAKSMMADLAKLLWCDTNGEDIYAFEKGLIFRPKDVKKAAYKAKYENLLKHMNTLIS